MSQVVKGNRPLRLFAGVMLLVLLVTHFLGHINLLEPSLLWLMVVMSVNALQASYTGFCPMFKNARGECVACGVACDEPVGKAKDSCCNTSSQQACCDGENNQDKKCC